MRCIACKGDLEPMTVTHKATVAGRTYSGKVPARRCVRCRETYTDAADLMRFELSVAEHLALHGPVSGEGLAFMREALGRTGREFAELLDVRPEHLSRWENGKRPIDRNAWLVAGGMVLDALAGTTTTLERLEGARKPERRKRIVLGPGRARPERAAPAE